MEMPDGWKRLKGGYFEAYFADRRYDQKSIICLSDLHKATDLLAEMAEALDHYGNDVFDATSLGDCDDKGQGKLARKTLKRFKDWK